MFKTNIFQISAYIHNLNVTITTVKKNNKRQYIKRSNKTYIRKIHAYGLVVSYRIYLID